jgi:anti-sigma factor RsiW
VNGTLEDSEAAKVARHLCECAECREDLEMERALAGHVRDLTGEEPGWAALKARIDGVRPLRPKARLFSRRIPVGWALLAQAASIAIVASLIIVTSTRAPQLYRTLGAVPHAATGNLVVIFKPDSSEAAMRTVLTQNQARIVDGPTATDAYVLHVAPEHRLAILARLKADRGISLAEPIDGDLR